MAVGICSVYDAYLVYAYREVIDEKNEFCKWLIELEPTFVSVFLLAKLSGTALVVASLFWLTRNWQRVATPVIGGMVLFQAGLMCYLHLSEETIKKYPDSSKVYAQYYSVRNAPHMMSASLTQTMDFVLTDTGDRKVGRVKKKQPQVLAQARERTGGPGRKGKMGRSNRKRGGRMARMKEHNKNRPAGASAIINSIN